MKHWHHIIPRHMGGTDDPSNLVELTVEEHAEAHRKLYEEQGHWQDYVAWQGLAKLNENFDAAKEAIKFGGKKGAKISNDKWKDPIYKEQRLKRWKESMNGKWGNSPCLGKKGAENLFAKEFLITHPDGKIELVKSLKMWCEENGLKYNTVHNMCVGRGKTHKGYTIKKIDS